MLEFLGNNDNFYLIAGPCAIEGKGICEDIAGQVKEICTKLEIPYVFKASYKKANRSRLDSFTGIGDEQAISILREIKKKFNLPVTTDVHTADEIKAISNFIDIIQIPAFLCRQTDLLITAAETGKIVNIKKGQFLSGEAMKYAYEKVYRPELGQVLLTERGTTFGYQDLVVDFRNIPIMQNIGASVVVDCTHSLQKPNQGTGVTGGDPSMIGTIASAAIATGANGIFIEIHPNPSKALSDGANMLQLSKLEALLEKLVRLYKAR